MWPALYYAVILISGWIIGARAFISGTGMAGASHPSQRQLVGIQRMTVWENPEELNLVDKIDAGQDEWLDDSLAQRTALTDFSWFQLSRKDDWPIMAFTLVFIPSFTILALIQLLYWMLLNFEWFQAYRYFWPLIGSLYAWNGWQAVRRPNTSKKLSMLCLDRQPSVVHILTGIAGIGLIIGGAYDAFMPVWMLGPNIITTAGIGQDSAAVLFLCTLMAFVRQLISLRACDDTAARNQSIGNPFAACEPSLVSTSVLLAQLYLLSDGSLNDLLTTSMDLMSDLKP